MENLVFWVIIIVAGSHSARENLQGFNSNHIRIRYPLRYWLCPLEKLTWATDPSSNVGTKLCVPQKKVLLVRLVILNIRISIKIWDGVDGQKMGKRGKSSLFLTLKINGTERFF